MIESTLSGIDLEWANTMKNIEDVDSVALSADQAMNECAQALARFRKFKQGSNFPSEIDYGKVVTLMVELERVVALP